MTGTNDIANGTRRLASGFADDSVSKTYRRQRYFVALALILMPLLTAWAGYTPERPLQPSLSDYYFTLQDGGLPRTLFIIFLAVLGGTLLTYRGLSDTDNRIHNAAGFLALGVALFPMGCDTCEHEYCVPGLGAQFNWLHGGCAGLLFVSAVVSVYYGGGPVLKDALRTLSKQDGKWGKRLFAIQLLSITLMSIGVLMFFFHKKLPDLSLIFLVEYLGFLGFGIYWLRLMWLINDVNEAMGIMHSAALDGFEAAARAASAKSRLSLDGNPIAEEATVPPPTPPELIP